MSNLLVLRRMLEPRLSDGARRWFRSASAELADGVSDARFCALLSLASRHARDSRPLDPGADDRTAAERAVEGWNPERWGLLEALRVVLVLSRPDLAAESAFLAIEEGFRFADEGELRALYRSLALLPEPERFAWRAGEGCRSNMRSVFEAAALDTPYPVQIFDDVAWRQAVIKCIFIEAPLWRMWGLDTRLSPELARMALDLADERRSAQRPVQHELWLCLGPTVDARALAALERELDPANPHTLGRRAAVYGLARAGRDDRLTRLVETEQDPVVVGTIRHALAGHTASTDFRDLDPDEA